jgi:MFS-type transporter involved in bile tolerance (Atg22 family)
LGFILFGFVYYGFAGASEKWHIWALFMLYGIFMGLTEGVQKAFIGTIIPQNMKATGYGIFNTFTGLAMLPASIIGGWLWDNISPSATFYFGAVTAGAATLLFIILIGIVKIKG